MSSQELNTITGHKNLNKQAKRGNNTTCKTIKMLMLKRKKRNVRRQEKKNSTVSR